MMRRWLHVVAGLALMSALSVSCSSDGCTNNRNSIPMAGFYELSSGRQLSVSGLEVYGVGAPNDSLLLDTLRNSQQVYLPLRGAQTQTSFMFKAGDVADVLTLTYDSYPYFDGEDCGAMWRYVITGVDYDRTLIDSVLVTDPVITNIERERLMIFLTIPEPELTPEPEPEPEPDVEAGTEQ